jgi:hypothetical protein
MSRYKIHFETAVLLSLLLHVVFIGGWEERAKLARLPVVGSIFAPLKPKPTSGQTAKNAPTKPAEPVITFVEEPEPTRPAPAAPKKFIETDNAQVTGEKPVITDLYSDRSTVAANPTNSTGKTGDSPHLDGVETRILSTADVTPRSGRGGPPLPPSPARPAIPARPASPLASVVPAPVLPPVEQPKPESTAPEVNSQKERKGVEKGSEKKEKKLPAEGWKKEAEKLALATPAPKPKPEPVKPPLPPAKMPPLKTELALKQPAPEVGRPGSEGSRGSPGGDGGSGSAREIAARKSRGANVGVNRIGVAAFNVAESPFGAYDKQVVRAVQSRWYALIEQNGLYERAGEVTIHFQLLSDGSVSGAEIKNSTAGEILALFCQKAVVESGPFAPWSVELRTYLGNEPRDVDFTFYY